MKTELQYTYMIHVVIYFLEEK